MRRPTLPALLLLAACSKAAPPPPAPPHTPAAPRAPTTATIADSHATPKVADLRTFGDWTAGCDNVGTCTIASLGGEGADFPAAAVAIVRDAGPAAPVTVTLAPLGDGPAPTRAAVDGRDFDPARQAAALVTAMADGHALTLRGSGVAAVQSLAGASAALRWMDAQQARAGNVTAIVAKGDRPASAVPAAAPLPVIVAVPPAGAATLPPAPMLADLARRAQCETRAPAEYWTPEAHALGRGATLVLIPCSAGAYNLSSALFVVRDRKPAPAQVDAPSGFDATGAEGEAVPSVVNGAWRDGVLTSYAKGRGLGDCGVAQSFVWDGTRLRLSEQSMMGECRGNPHYIPTWRAKVVRR